MTLPLPLPAMMPIAVDEEVVSASADGIVQCLRLLADEATTLNLPHTRLAIQDAVRAALLENGVGIPRPSRRLLH